MGDFSGGPISIRSNGAWPGPASGGDSLLPQYGSMPRVDFARQIAVLFGCSPVGANAQAQLERAIGTLVRQLACPEQD